MAGARHIYAEAKQSGALATGATPAQVRLNLTVTDVPFSTAPVDVHVDSSGGEVVLDTGHLPSPDVSVSLDYATARSLFLAGDIQAVMQAFLAGRIKVDGDLSKLLGPGSNIWPVGSPSGVPGFPGPWSAPGAGTPGSGTPGSGTPGSDGPGPGLPRPEALQVTARLQEMTE